MPLVLILQVQIIIGVLILVNLYFLVNINIRVYSQIISSGHSSYKNANDIELPNCVIMIIKKITRGSVI